MWLTSYTLIVYRHIYLFSTIVLLPLLVKQIWNSPKITHYLATTRLDMTPKASNGRDSRAALQTQVATSRPEHVAVLLERLPPYVLPKINHLHQPFCGRLWWHLCLQKSSLHRHVATLPVVVRGEGKAVKILHAFEFCVEKSGFLDFTNHMSCVSAW